MTKTIYYNPRSSWTWAHVLRRLIRCWMRGEETEMVSGNVWWMDGIQT